MTAIVRLASRHWNTPFLNHERKLLMSVRSVTLQPVPAPPAPPEDHDERNMKLGRPQSPHLTIYAPQMTTMLSISHRMTGMALSAYCIALGVGAVVLPDSIPHYIDALQSCHLAGPTIFISKFMIGFPFAYHFCNGIRHLAWDTGKFFTMKEVYKTGYLMLGVTTVLTIALTTL